MPAFERRVIVLAPGEHRPYRAEEWGDALVSIDSGEIRLECAGKTPRPFRPGDLLWLGGLGLSAIHNPGPVPAVLIATSRRLHSATIDSRRPT
jgi:hypothetical protein